MLAASAAMVLDVDTPHGLARAHVQHPAGARRGAVVLGHGAGGSVSAPDLVAATRVALDLGFGVALVEQPYRVAGRRSAAPARQLDAAWLAVVERLRSADAFGEAALVAGGRSSARGSRAGRGADRRRGVLCLAFPAPPAAPVARRRARRPGCPSSRRSTCPS
jgi:predicted alpha/beta-hydrolase family hydrolase